MTISMTSDQEALATYDNRDETYPIKLGTEVLESNYKSEIKFTKFYIFLSEEIDESRS